MKYTNDELLSYLVEDEESGLLVPKSGFVITGSSPNDEASSEQIDYFALDGDGTVCYAHGWTPLSLHNVRVYSLQLVEPQL